MAAGRPFEEVEGNMQPEVSLAGDATAVQEGQEEATPNLVLFGMEVDKDGKIVSGGDDVPIPVEDGEGALEGDALYNAVKTLMKGGILVDDEIDPKGFAAEDYVNEVIQATVNARLEELTGSLPGVVRNLVRYASNGGDVEAFMRNYRTGSSGGLKKGMDLSTPEAQERVVRIQLANEGFSKEAIDEQLEMYHASEKLGTMANRLYQRWEKSYEEREARMLEEQRQSVESEREARRKLRNVVAERVQTNPEVCGIRLNSSDRADIARYMTERSITMGNGQIVTPMQRDIYTALQDTEKAIALAKILRSGMDFSEILSQAETKVTDRIKTGLRRTEGMRRDSSVNGGKSLSDYFG